MITKDSKSFSPLFIQNLPVVFCNHLKGTKEFLSYKRLKQYYLLKKKLKTKEEKSKITKEECRKRQQITKEKN